MAREPEPRDDDEIEDEEPPRVRPVRMVVASAVGILATVGAALSWFVMYPSHPRPEPQGSAAAILQPAGALVGLLAFVICALVVMVSAITLVRALREARAAGRP